MANGARDTSRKSSLPGLLEFDHWMFRDFSFATRTWRYAAEIEEARNGGGVINEHSARDFATVQISADGGSRADCLLSVRNPAKVSI
jgi:hypothetical protein